jgi:hypothetical protein
MNTQIEQPNQPSSEAEKLARPSKMSRREALAIVGKHAVFTPHLLCWPYCLLTKSTDARASVCVSTPGNPCPPD